MPTQKYTITNAEGWVKVAASASDNLLLENASMLPFYMALTEPNAAAPDADTEAFHRVYGRERIQRVTLSNDIYVRTADEFDIEPAEVVVSVD